MKRRSGGTDFREFGVAGEGRARPVPPSSLPSLLVAVVWSTNQALPAHSLTAALCAHRFRVSTLPAAVPATLKPAGKRVHSPD
jgi:hypothetical protein